jgi:hypothetical protein
MISPIYSVLPKHKSRAAFSNGGQSIKTCQIRTVKTPTKTKENSKDGQSEGQNKLSK